MENDNLGFPPDRERLEYIERTVREHSAQDEVDIKRIVVNAMNAYWDPRIKDLPPDMEEKTASLLRQVAGLIHTRAETVNGLLGVLVPSVVYLSLLYILVSQRGDWETPISLVIVLLAVIFPIALAITLFVVSGPRQELRLRPLGVLRNTVSGFMTRVATGAACGGLILTALTAWAVIYIVDGNRERRAITFNFAKNTLVDKSFSAMKDLQVPDSKVVESTAEIKVSATNIMPLRTQPASPKLDSGKSVIEDQGAFPGQLSAHFNADSATVFWTEEGKSGVAQTKIYVCTIKSISGDKVFVEAISRPSSESKGDSVTQNPADDLDNNTVIRSISLEVNGTSIELSFNPQLVNAHEFSKGENLILAYDTKTNVASRIERLFSSAALRD